MHLNADFFYKNKYFRFTAKDLNLEFMKIMGKFFVYKFKKSEI